MARGSPAGGAGAPAFVRVRSMSALPLVVAVAACGDPIAPGDYIGEAALELEGILCGDVPPVRIEQPTVGVLWKWRQNDREQWEVSNHSAVPARSFPAHFRVPLFDLPPAVRPNRYATSDGSMVASVGCPLVFDDLDRDGRYGPGDVFVGVSWKHLVVRVHEDADVVPGLPLSFQTTGHLEPGYHLVEGACDAGHSVDRLKPAAPDTAADIRFLESPGRMPATPPDACIRFF